MSVRLKKECCGDCAQCELLAGGEVEMVPCVLDQLFRRVQAQGEAIKRLAERGQCAPSALAASENDKKE